MFFKNLSFYFKFYLVFAFFMTFFFILIVEIFYNSIEKEHKSNILEHYKKNTFIDGFNSIKRVYFLEGNSIYKIDDNYIEANFKNKNYYKLINFENLLKDCKLEVKCINEKLNFEKELLFKFVDNN